jgi:hypothetical protein
VPGPVLLWRWRTLLFLSTRASPRVKATKRKPDDDKPFVNSPDGLRVLLYCAITSHGSAEVALLHIMKQYFINDVGALQQVLEGPSSILLFFSEMIWVRIPSLEDQINFSNVRYEHIAPLVGLDPNFEMDDIGTFDLYRSRIPTALFKSIVQDIDVMLVQYGPQLSIQRKRRDPVSYHRSVQAISLTTNELKLLL